MLYLCGILGLTSAVVSQHLVLISAGKVILETPQFQIVTSLDLLLSYVT